MSDEFYVGYEPEMPPVMARRVRGAVVALAALAVIIPSVLVLAHRKVASAVFEFGHTRSVEGRIVESPYPALSTTDASGTRRLYWLVSSGKHGANDLVEGLDGALARVSGTLIQRDDDAMLQVEPGGIAVVARLASWGPTVGGSLAVTMTGEIVDAKCHLGVMKPGEGPTHRDCAVRCLFGGLPPMFVPRDGATESVGRLVIVTREGRALPPGALTRLVGKPVTVHGTTFERAGQRFLGVAEVAAATGRAHGRP